MQCHRAWRAYHPGKRLQHANLWQWPRQPRNVRAGPYGQRRNFGLQSIPTVLLPPVVFGGLLVTLWTYKCLMMVIFQNKIIYMPGVPPFSRSEKVSDYASQCLPFTWSEHDIKAADGTAIKLLEGGSNTNTSALPVQQQRRVVVLYLQG